MKKLIFAIMAIACLSTSAVYAEGGKHIKKHRSGKTCPCPKNCTKNCPKTAVCPTIQGNICS
ncbi:MAG TPA: hypothetical protein VGO09_01470 [Flavisolibacter sp.]|jgi:hypothetical protein|nr:hypothetical protein [Flavisolibacter sp.]